MHAFNLGSLPVKELLIPLGALLVLWLVQKSFGVLGCLLRSIFGKRGRGRSLLVFACLLLSPGVAFCQEPPPPPVVYENIMIWGFVSAVAVFGALFSFYVVKKSIFRGLDLLERD